MAIAKVEPLTSARALRGPFDYLLPERLGEVEVGSVLLVPFGRQRVLGVVVDVAERSELPPERLTEPLEAIEAGVPAELVRLGLWAGREYCSTPARGLRLVLPPGMNGSGHLPRARKRKAPPDAGPRAAPASPASASPQLTPAQNRAREAVAAALDGHGERELLLHGVTGSGKTEVYMAAVQDALARGQGAIVLVPEIALTPQTVGRFQARFGDQVALLHSGLAAGRRADEWRRLRSGEARVCVGPRSAIFAPVARLGLIVIDEEHDASYKQESDPRYDAREVARHRAGEAEAVLLCGSATPRPESWVRLTRLDLPERVDGRPLPPVEILDMRRGDSAGAPGKSSVRGRVGAGPLHSITRAALQELRAGGGKAIVLLNRRGFATYLECRSCGHAWQCPDCDVSLVLHAREDAMRCHHCGHSEPIPDRCPECSSVTLGRHGAGTQRVEAAIAELVEPLPVFRLDSDSAARAGAHAEVLGAFAESDGGVLIGTQMVAKGHDFPEVTLSVVLDADATLRFPDFRAEERAFALVAQLAGRSGRGEGGGRVLVQTLAPEAECIRAAARHDSIGFLKGELERRRELRYPPFAHLVRVELSAKEASIARRAAEGIGKRLAATLPEGAELLGPAPRMRLRARHRIQLLIRSPKRAAAVDAVRAAVEGAASARELGGASLSVDVDPQ